MNAIYDWSQMQRCVVVIFHHLFNISIILYLYTVFFYFSVIPLRGKLSPLSRCVAWNGLICLIVALEWHCLMTASMATPHVTTWWACPCKSCIYTITCSVTKYKGTYLYAHMFTDVSSYAQCAFMYLNFQQASLSKGSRQVCWHGFANLCLCPTPSARYNVGLWLSQSYPCTCAAHVRYMHGTLM